MAQKEVKLHWRELTIAYNVDFETISTLAEKYGIDWADMKKALRQYGCIIRKGEPKPAEPIKDYKVILVDTEKIVELPDEASPKATRVVVATAK